MSSRDHGHWAAPLRPRFIAAAAMMVASTAIGAPAPPVLGFSTFLGGSGLDSAKIVRVDRAGNVYIAGTTQSSNFPVTPNAYQKTGPTPGCYLFGPPLVPCASIFLSKFSPDGALLYSTYLGQPVIAVLGGMGVDDAGAVYIAGSDWSPYSPRAFPNMTPVSGYTLANSGPWFVVKLKPDGSSLAYATALPHVPAEFEIQSVAVDRAGGAYLTGTAGTGLPVVNAFQPARAGATVFKTSDSGRTWQTSNPGAAEGMVDLVAVDPTNPQRVYVGYHTALYRSSDGGGSWSAVLTKPPGDAGTPFSELRPSWLAVDPVRPDTLYLGTSALGIFKSTDGGTTWQPSGAGASRLVRMLAIDPSNPSTVYAATQEGLFKSTDAGATWAATSLTTSVSRIVIDPGAPARLYAGTGQGVMKSADGGATWSPKTNGFGASVDVAALAIDAADPRTLYASTSGNRAPFRTSDGGENWSPGQWSSGTFAQQLVVDGATHTTVWAGTDAGLMVSRDSGATWAPTATQLPAVAIRGLAASSTGDLYAIANAAEYDAFAMKLDPAGSTLAYSTYLGGTGMDGASAIAVDGQGRAYVAGWTDSFDFPGAGGAQGRIGGFRDGFVSSLDASGRLAWFTYFGGSGNDYANGVAVDAAGNVHISGWTESPDLRLRNPSQAALKGTRDGFAAKLKGDGSDLLFATYVGGSFLDYANAVAADAAGNTYIAGLTYSSDLPTVNAVQPTAMGNGGAFAAAWDDSTGALQWMTYLGGGLNDSANSIALDAGGAAYVAGTTSAGGFPARYAFQPGFAGVQDAFIAKIAPDSLVPKAILSAVTDAAGYGDAIAPGSLVALFGANLAISTAQAGGFPLPRQLADIRVAVNGVDAPLYYASPFQVDAQIPFETAPGTAVIQVTSSAGSATLQKQVVSTAPALFALDATGSGPGAIQHGVTYEVVTDANPAIAGEVVAVYCTGFGAVDPPLGTGTAAGVPLSYTREEPQVYIGGLRATVTYSGLTPSLAGVYQLNAEIPSGLAPGRQPVQVISGSRRSNLVLVAVK